MNRDNKYINYLLRNSFRLEKELKKDDSCYSREEKKKLKRDVKKTILFYKNINIIYKEAMTLRYLKGYLIKEVAKKTNFSVSHLKTIYRNQKENLKHILEG